ncbi:hypothetical protein I7I53_11024 [Histoplasma capsulatum var. duboisii H88]|uniref:Uncharacterized protein n=1 Tax=Ajellomyces capsulatus (strain H88) TaxID=544711 RepID=A0A8A1L9R5_AJEC8|nr:hypothetical protein I7I53_11024 [Histoplasma capsulatum var. duboisii H88]
MPCDHLYLNLGTDSYKLTISQPSISINTHKTLITLLILSSSFIRNIIFIYFSALLIVIVPSLLSFCGLKMLSLAHNLLIIV